MSAEKPRRAYGTGSLEIRTDKHGRTHEGMHELMFDARLGEVAGTLAGVDGIRIWHDQALIKPPFGNATAWHLDNPYWSFSSKNSISIWMALDDAITDVLLRAGRIADRVDGLGPGAVAGP